MRPKITTNSVALVSLPRTGTTSFGQMMEHLGYVSKHAPLTIEHYLQHGFALSDTPTYTESTIKELLDQPLNIKLVYIDRDYDSWYHSMLHSTILLKTYIKMLHSEHGPQTYGQEIDLKCYREVLGDLPPEYPPDIVTQGKIKQAFFEHRDMCLSYDAFIWKFEDGWAPICEYLELPIPKQEIPHLHNVTFKVKS